MDVGSATIMVETSKHISNAQPDKAQQQWLEKLWLHLFDGDSGGLMSPGQILRERRNHAQVREMELAAIKEAERDIEAIHNGTKRLDDNGNLIDTPLVETVSTHSIIENTMIEQNQDVGVDSSASLLKSAIKQVSINDLERSLNLRKIALLAEKEILDAPQTAVSPQPIGTDWLARWKQSAQDVFDSQLALMWARLLVVELARPGSFSIGVMATLSQVGPNDTNTLSIASKYLIEDFIYDATDGYFTEAAHSAMLDNLIDLGIVVDNGAQAYLFSIASQSKDRFSKLLRSHDKALQVTAAEPDKIIQLPIFKLTRVGRHLLSLSANDADLAYLFTLARFLKSEGFDVALGDWLESGEGFVEKLKV